MENGITVCIPHLPVRSAMLARALESVARQTLAPTRIIVEPDPHSTGAAATRNRALAQVDTEYVAWLDDDDELYPHHLEVCLSSIETTGADLVYPDYDINVAVDHRPSFIQVTNLMRTEALVDVGGFPQPLTGAWPYMYEDWGMLARLLVKGYRFQHIPEVTWRYNIHQNSTSGLTQLTPVGGF